MTTPAERASGVRHAIAEIIAEHGGQWNGAVDAAVDAVLRQAFREPEAHRYRVGDRVSRNGVPGTVRARTILVDMSTDAPAVLAYVVVFDDGRRLTVEEAALDV